MFLMPRALVVSIISSCALYGITVTMSFESIWYLEYEPHITTGSANTHTGQGTLVDIISAYIQVVDLLLFPIGSDEMNPHGCADP